jgi:hypothetical protein
MEALAGVGCTPALALLPERIPLQLKEKIHFMVSSDVNPADYQDFA